MRKKAGAERVPVEVIKITCFRLEEEVVEGREGNNGVVLTF
jgi:hypothetical protein